MRMRRRLFVRPPLIVPVVLSVPLFVKPPLIVAAAELFMVPRTKFVSPPAVMLPLLFNVPELAKKICRC